MIIEERLKQRKFERRKEPKQNLSQKVKSDSANSLPEINGIKLLKSLFKITN